MNDQQKVSFEQHIPDVLVGLNGIHQVIDSHNLDRTLYHLILLRASQLNGCDYCIELHTREAIEDGEKTERLDQLTNWRESSLYSPSEKVAFKWTEALTQLENGKNLACFRNSLRKYFSDKQISLITVNIAMINLWNRIQVSNH